MKTLSERMRGYESVSKTSLVPRVPVIVRIDGLDEKRKWIFAKVTPVIIDNREFIENIMAAL